MPRAKLPLRITPEKVALACQGMIDYRTKLGREVQKFMNQIRAGYGNDWTPMQEHRLQIARPALVRFLTEPPVDPETGEDNPRWVKAHFRLTQALQDVRNMGSGRPPRSLAKIKSGEWLERFTSAFGVENR